VWAPGCPVGAASCVESPVPKGEYENIGEPECSGDCSNAGAGSTRVGSALIRSASDRTRARVITVLTM